MYPRYCIPPIVIIDFCHALAKVVRRIFRHKTRRICPNCEMQYCDWTRCKKIDEAVRKTAAEAAQRRPPPVAAPDLLQPWAETVEQETRGL
jgi:hypothetical protein